MNLQVWQSWNKSLLLYSRGGWSPSGGAGVENQSTPSQHKAPRKLHKLPDEILPCKRFWSFKFKCTLHLSNVGIEMCHHFSFPWFQWRYGLVCSHGRLYSCNSTKIAGGRVITLKKKIKKNPTGNLNLVVAQWDQWSIWSLRRYSLVLKFG